MIIPERACALISVEERLHLVLPVTAGQPARLAAPPAAMRGATIVCLLAGGPSEDFRWLPGTVDGLRPERHGTPGAGVAAALAARLCGLVAGSRAFLGMELPAGPMARYHPPAGAWWDGIWHCDAAPGSGISEGPAPQAMGPGASGDGRPPSDTPCAAAEGLPFSCQARLLIHGELVLR